MSPHRRSCQPQHVPARCGTPPHTALCTAQLLVLAASCFEQRWDSCCMPWLGVMPSHRPPIPLLWPAFAAAARLHPHLLPCVAAAGLQPRRGAEPALFVLHSALHHSILPRTTLSHLALPACPARPALPCLAAAGLTGLMDPVEPEMASLPSFSYQVLSCPACSALPCPALPCSRGAGLTGLTVPLAFLSFLL